MARSMKVARAAPAGRRAYSSAEREAAVADVAKSSLTEAAREARHAGQHAVQVGEGAAGRATAAPRASEFPAEATSQARPDAGKLKRVKPAQVAKRHTPSQRAQVLEAAA